MSNPLILKLRRGVELTHDDCVVLERVSARTRQVGPHVDIIREGDVPDEVHLVMTGMACRAKMVADGGRSIMALLVPGDFCDLHVAILGEMDHTITTLTSCTMVDIPRRMIMELTEHHPKIARAFWWATLVDEAILREWLVNMGRRDADLRTAHFFCELLVRLQSVGLADHNSYDLQLTQHELSDLLALSPVHMNRTLQTLRAAKLISLRGKRLTILDVDRLCAFAGFTPNYLHLDAPVRSLQTPVALSTR